MLARIRADSQRRAGIIQQREFWRFWSDCFRGGRGDWGALELPGAPGFWGLPGGGGAWEVRVPPGAGGALWARGARVPLRAPEAFEGLGGGRGAFGCEGGERGNRPAVGNHPKHPAEKPGVYYLGPDKEGWKGDQQADAHDPEDVGDGDKAAPGVLTVADDAVGIADKAFGADDFEGAPEKELGDPAEAGGCAVGQDKEGEEHEEPSGVDGWNQHKADRVKGGEPEVEEAVGNIAVEGAPEGGGPPVDAADKDNGGDKGNPGEGCKAPVGDKVGKSQGKEEGAEGGQGNVNGEICQRF